eukprot:gene1951-1189_t
MHTMKEKWWRRRLIRRHVYGQEATDLKVARNALSRKKILIIIIIILINNNNNKKKQFRISQPSRTAVMKGSGSKKNNNKKTDCSLLLPVPPCVCHSKVKPFLYPFAALSSSSFCFYCLNVDESPLRFVVSSSTESLPLYPSSTRIAAALYGTAPLRPAAHQLFI